MHVILNGEHAVKSVFDGLNPSKVDEIAFAVKSCVAGMRLHGFDFIQDMFLDFIRAKRRFQRDVVTISLNKQKKSRHTRFFVVRVCSFCLYKFLGTAQ